MTNVDTSRAPLGELAARALIDAVVANDDRIERHYLELKSELDLGAKRDQAKLAKFILGAANRMPDVAAAAFDGYAVMVIGAGEGSAAGIAPVEALDIQKAVLPFIGADGPRYDLLRVACVDSSNEILMIIVDPPKVGQDPFLCQKAGDGLRDGAIYVRADGETREARADEMRLLIARGRTTTVKAVGFGVRVVGVVRPVVLDETLTLEAFIGAHRRRLANALRAAKSPASSVDPIDGMLGASFSSMIRQAQLASAALTDPESRSEEAYNAAIDEWESEVREAWPAAIVRLMGGLCSPVEIEIANLEKTFLHDVELKVHIEGEVFGVDEWKAHDGIKLRDLDIPAPPRKWGPTPSKLSDFGHLVGSHRHLLAPRYDLPSISRTNWTNSGSVDVSFTVGQLRPKEIDKSSDLGVALCTWNGEMSLARGTWQVTARDHHEVYEGTLEVEIGDVLDLTREFRLVFGLE